MCSRYSSLAPGALKQRLKRPVTCVAHRLNHHHHPLRPTSSRPRYYHAVPRYVASNTRTDDCLDKNDKMDYRTTIDENTIAFMVQ